MGMFDFLKGFQPFAAELRGMRRQLEEKKQRRDMLKKQPLCKADVLRVTGLWIDGCKLQYEQSLRVALFHIAQTPHEAEKFAVEQGIPLLRAGTHHLANPTLQNMEINLLALFADQVRDSLKVMIERIDWPEGGIPLQERAKVLAKLDAEIEDLEARIADANAKLAEAQTELEQ